MLLLLVGCGKPKDDSTADNNGLPLEALNYNPKAADLNIQLALGYLDQGDIERSKTKLLLAQKQNPNSSEISGAMAYYYDKIGNAKEADRYYRQAYSRASDKGDAANNYGVFLCRQKNYTDADRYFEKAVNDPSYVHTAQAYENLGLCAVAKPDPVSAKKYFLQALRIDQTLATSLLQMAQLSFQAKDFPEANHYLDYYSAVGQNSADVLWLKIQVAQGLGNQNNVSSLGLQLKDSYPNSEQYRLYLASMRGTA